MTYYDKLVKKKVKLHEKLKEFTEEIAKVYFMQYTFIINNGFISETNSLSIKNMEKEYHNIELEISKIEFAMETYKKCEQECFPFNITM